MFAFIVGTFVIASCVFMVAFVMNGIRGIRTDRAYLDQQIREDVEAGIFPDWIYGQDGITKSTGK